MPMVPELDGAVTPDSHCLPDTGHQARRAAAAGSSCGLTTLSKLVMIMSLRQAASSFLCPPGRPARQLPNTAVLNLDNLIDYLAEVEDELHNSATPAVRFQHCVILDDPGSYLKSLGLVFAKPIIRTLIYNNNTASRSAFDQRQRQARLDLERTRMFKFAMGELRPRASELDRDMLNEYAPNLLRQLDDIERLSEDPELRSAWQKVTLTNFSRCATGRHYKGRLSDLIEDLFPDLAEKYAISSRSVSEREVILHLAEVDLVEEDDSNFDSEFTQRRRNALRKCIDIFYPPDAVADTASSNESRQSGHRCEQSCLEYLCNHYINEVRDRNSNEQSPVVRILRNVHVVNRRSPTSKYIPPKVKRRGANSGIVWVNGENYGFSRHRKCSEFDAVVVVGDRIDSIWEAKKTVTPSATHDILTKKVEAIESLQLDPSAELQFQDDEGKTTRKIPFQSQIGKLQLGVYTEEIQKAANSADSIRSIAASHAIADIEKTIAAVERAGGGEKIQIEVQLDSALEIIQNLRQKVESKRRGNDIILVVQNETRTASPDSESKLSSQPS